MSDLPKAFIERSRRYLRADYLPKIERCLARLSDDDLWWRPNPASNSIGNLLLHLSGNVRQWLLSGVGGAPDERRRQEEFDARASMTGEQLLAGLRQTLAEVDRLLETLNPDSLPERRQIQGRDVSVMEAIYHVVEHFSMHTGQIIFITKMRTGEDLSFYDVQGGTARPTWHTPSAE